MLTNTNGILLLNKPQGITSFKALGAVKRILRDFTGSKIKVGHTGTLDSFAEGLLVVLTGKFTRLNGAFTAFDKSYEASILFGTETDTLDHGGKIIKTAEIPDFETIKRVAAGFTGQLKQRPPIYSAVHVNGERAYKKALKGTITELPERDIRIDHFEFLDWTPPVLKCRIDCSKGTYIRSIARDMGSSCGSCGSLSALKRLTVGPFSVLDSINSEDFSPESDLLYGRKAFELLSETMPEDFGLLEAKKSRIPLMKNGTALADNFFTKAPAGNGRYAVFSDDVFIAYIDYNAGNYSYIFVG